MVEYIMSKYRIKVATSNEKPLVRTFYNKKELLSYVANVKKLQFWFRIEKIKQ